MKANIQSTSILTLLIWFGVAFGGLASICNCYFSDINGYGTISYAGSCCGPQGRSGLAIVEGYFYDPYWSAILGTDVYSFDRFYMNISDVQGQCCQIAINQTPALESVS